MDVGGLICQKILNIVSSLESKCRTAWFQQEPGCFEEQLLEFIFSREKKTPCYNKRILLNRSEKLTCLLYCDHLSLLLYTNAFMSPSVSDARCSLQANRFSFHAPTGFFFFFFCHSFGWKCKIRGQRAEKKAERL